MPVPPRRVGRPTTPRTTTISLPRRALLPPPAQDIFNAPLYTLKAFSIATVIVASTATLSVAGIMTYLNVHSTQEFADRMRTWVSHTMPRLTATIYRRPTARDVIPGDPVLLAASTPQQVSSSATVDHEAAQNRLAEAFDKGGLDAWVEVAAKEMEAEIQAERSRRST